jgi:hypothetical protein
MCQIPRWTVTKTEREPAIQEIEKAVLACRRDDKSMVLEKLNCPLFGAASIRNIFGKIVVTLHPREAQA